MQSVSAAGQKMWGHRQQKGSLLGGTLSLPPFSSLAHSHLPLPFPALPLEVGTLKSSSLGERCQLPQRGL